MFVARIVLQADDLGREIADLLLRLVDAGQPLAQVGDDLAGRLVAAVEPLVDHAGKGALLLAQRLLDPLHGIGQRRLRPGIRASRHQDRQPTPSARITASKT